jgi:sec-independent protein translocase protein TatB
VFGVSFTELLLIGAVALLIVGPKRLPAMLGTLGRWTAKLRKITTEVRYQSGIDDILRKEGFSGGLSELRQLQNVARGGIKSLVASSTAQPGRPQPARAQTTGTVATTSSAGAAQGSAVISVEDPYAHVPYDRSREYPSEGCDCAGALPDDLWSEPLLPRRNSAPASAN